MNQKPKFDVLYSEEVLNFLKSLDPKASNKILFNIDKCRYVIDSTLFKKLKDTYRIFAFGDMQSNSLVLTTHGIIKKSPKTPGKEIEKAISIRKEYLKGK